jgi:hypothetical protein
MILLTIDAAIFDEFASGTFLEFDVINFRFAARCTYFSGLLAAHGNIIHPTTTAEPLSTLHQRQSLQATPAYSTTVDCSNAHHGTRSTLKREDKRRPPTGRSPMTVV